MSGTFKPDVEGRTDLTLEELKRAFKSLNEAAMEIDARDLIWWAADGKAYDAGRNNKPRPGFDRQKIPVERESASIAAANAKTHARADFGPAPPTPRKFGNRAMRRKRDHYLWRAMERPLDRLNATVYFNQDRHLHPTKGFRKLNPKRTFASDVASRWKRGLVDYNVWNMKHQLALIGANKT